jgi:ADP-ribosylglycohydrolase
MQTEAIAGCILGCAVGDAIGLPYEGLSRRRGVRLIGEPTRHRFLPGRGMVSDDTEHTCMAGQALCECPADPDAFARAFARRLRWWLLGGPAGIGSATLRATIKLWAGFSPANSGVFSAGNGPAMRSAVLGAAETDGSARVRIGGRSHHDIGLMLCETAAAPAVFSRKFL